MHQNVVLFWRHFLQQKKVYSIDSSCSVLTDLSAAFCLSFAVNLNKGLVFFQTSPVPGIGDF